MKFTPLKFQGTLAAGGVALMPYIFLKNNIFRTDASISWTHLESLSTGAFEHMTALLLIVVMGLFITIHLCFTLIFLRQLVNWILKTNGLNELMDNPLTSSAMFSPLISLPMSLVVFFGPCSFFFPQITTNLQTLILPTALIFSLLWVALILLKVKDIRTLFTTTVEYKKLSFGWLLDVLAFGAVSLLGANITNFAASSVISSTVAFMTMVSLLMGMVIFVIKVSILLSQQFKSQALPAVNILPAFFLVVPPMCLLGFSFFKMLNYSSTFFAFDTKVIAFLVMIFSYLIAMGWFVFVLFLLKEYFTKKFLTSEFSPAQWGIV